MSDPSKVAWLTAVGQRLAAARAAAGLSQADLAERIGVHRQTVYRWEAGTQPPDAYGLAMACLVCGVDVGAVLTT